MTKFEEIVKQIKDELKANLSADNTEVITKLDKKVDELVESHSAIQKKLNETQELYINQMKEVGFKTPQDDSNNKQEPKTDEEAWDMLLEEALKNDKEDKK